MLKIFENLKEKDEKAINEYKIESDVLMESAALGVKEKIVEVAYSNEPFYKAIKNGLFNIEEEKKKTVQIVCGSSDNGGDGLALSRSLQSLFTVITVLPKKAKSNMCLLQKERLELLGIKIQEKIEDNCDILVDALFGTGFTGKLRDEDVPLLAKMNSIGAYKIALDVPSGLSLSGVPSGECFKADLTICIGALRAQLFSSLAKDYVGKIVLKRLALPNEKYEGESHLFLLEKKDGLTHLPYRHKKNVNKGTFGHVAVVQGEKKGAAQLVADAALSFGAGLVTIVGKDVPSINPNLMQSEDIPQHASSIVLGSGLGRENKDSFNKYFLYILEHQEIPLVLDADFFYYDELKFLLDQDRQIVLTPHVKEFASLLKISLNIDLSLNEVKERETSLIKTFCTKYKKAVLVLKDCNTFIGQAGNIYINNLGSPALAKAGTGDVLAGLVVALLAQQKSPLLAASTASLIHAIASKKVKNNYALVATELIKTIREM